MKKKIHSESEKVKAVQELESGIDAESVARGHGISRSDKNFSEDLDNSVIYLIICNSGVEAPRNYIYLLII
jgi:hypothetical protein